MPVPGLDVGQPVMLVGRRPERLGQQGEAVERERQLAAACAEERAVGADQVAQVEAQQAIHRVLAQHIHARVELQPARAVDEVQERRLALPAARREPARDARAHVGLRPGGQLGVRRLDVGYGLDARELVRKGLDPGGA